MRPHDDLIDPEIEAQLAAIDATLAGAPVDPEHAEIAELALLLAAGRPAIEPEFATALDARAQHGFAPEDAPRTAWRSLRVLGSAVAACAAVIVALVVVVGSGSGTAGAPSRTATGSSALGSVRASSASGASASSARSPASAVARAVATPTTVTGSPVVPAPVFGPANQPASGASPQPVPNGRKVVQSAQLALTTRPARVASVAQEVFNVVGAEHGIVNNSSVTATGGSDGYAHFSLSIPSGNLPETMNRLSQLRYAAVASRTDTTQDVNGSFVSVGRRLSEARALRTSLLRQLAGASTSAQIASLRAQLHDADAAIARAESGLRSLSRRVNFSAVTVTVAAGAAPRPVGSHPGSGSFGLGQAVHDAGRVLTVAAGVALIVLAVLVPLALVGLLVWWAGSALRRRRREQALDLA